MALVLTCTGTIGFFLLRGSDAKARTKDYSQVAKAETKSESAAPMPSAEIKAGKREDKPEANSDPKAEPISELKPDPMPIAKAPARAPERQAEPDDRIAFFETKIRPVLVRHCYECHSAEAQQAKKLRGGLLLDSRQGMRKGGDSGPAIVPWKAGESLLIQALKYDGTKMPPKQQLPNEVVADFVKWVDMGAPDPRVAPATAVVKKPAKPEAAKEHWAFQPLRDVAPPPVAKQGWPKSPVDQFILARLEEQQLNPNPPASKEKLIRRAYFDLWGLPPAPADIDAFLKDSTPDAYSKLIDRLLASERYGERWARHWLDVVRFAESGGYEFDKDRPTAYHYRDFVIKALNQDMPYQQFTRYQIAGDLLNPGDYQATAATGFLVAGPFPGQTTAKTNEITRYDHLDDMVSTIGNAMLGLSLGCARCHDHKFDALPQEDYYRLIACLAKTDSAQVKVGAEQTDLFAAIEKPGGIQYANEGGQQPKVIDTVHFLGRGEVERKNGVAPPGFLRALMNTPQKEKRWTVAPPELDLPPIHPRVALASWLVDARHGAGSLLARVIVNRLWQHHLGRGLVATPNDFGVKGESPTHPELLDWLAGELIREGWKLKAIHKLIMTSAVYMQSSDATPAALQADPQNRLWWRTPTRRLDAEAMRDALLSVSGTLDLTMYGPGTLNENVPRRSVYLTVKRTQPIPILQLFDAPEAIQSVGDRSATTVAPQALALLNSPFVRQRAEQLAQRTAPKTPDLVPKMIDDVYRTALGRKPTAAERKTMQTFITKQTASGRGPQALADFCQVVLCLHEFAYID
jgi:hypothetical protein